MKQIHMLVRGNVPDIIAIKFCEQVKPQSESRRGADAYRTYCNVCKGFRKGKRFFYEIF